MDQHFEGQETNVHESIPTTREEDTSITSPSSDPVQEQAVTDILEKARRENYRGKIVWHFLLCLVMIPVVLALLCTKEAASWLLSCLMTLGGIGLVLYGYSKIDKTLQPPPPFDIEELARVGGSRAIGPLLDALDTLYGMHNEDRILTALLPLLQQLKAPECSLITSSQRERLRVYLRTSTLKHADPSPQDEILLAILRVTKLIGDKRAIPDIRGFLRRNVHTEYGQYILQAAQECISALELMPDGTEEELTLLRPSSADHSMPDTLLRPAHAVDETPSTELLRASEGENHQA